MEVPTLFKITSIKPKLMETYNTTNKNTYSFIAVPTQLFILLDSRLKLVLTSLIQVSTALANSNGWFFYSNDDLKKVCGIKSEKTIRACIETLYRLNIVQVQARTFENNIGKRTANYYRVNFKEFEKYNEYSVYECLNIPELHIAMLDYTSKDYQTTYTAATNCEDSIPESSEASNSINEEIPSNDGENASEGLKTSIPDLEYDVEDCPLTEDEFDELMKWNNTPVSERMKECEEPADELSFLDDDDDVKVAEAPAEEVTNDTKQVKFEDKKIETASVIPSDLFEAEKREVQQLNINEKSVQACKDLVQRYKQMTFKNSNECAELCKQASIYITKKYNQGEIYLEDKDRLIRELVNTRFEKFSI